MTCLRKINIESIHCLLTNSIYYFLCVWPRYRSQEIASRPCTRITFFYQWLICSLLKQEICISNFFCPKGSGSEVLPTYRWVLAAIRGCWFRIVGGCWSSLLQKVCCHPIFSVVYVFSVRFRSECFLSAAADVLLLAGWGCDVVVFRWLGDCGFGMMCGVVLCGWYYYEYLITFDKFFVVC